MAAEDKVRDWRIIKTRWDNVVNYNYSNIENCRFLEWPYTELQSTFDRDDSWVEKRYPYTALYSNLPTGWYITDSIRIFNDWCKDVADKTYYMWKSFDGSKMKIYANDVYQCNIFEIAQQVPLCTCECWYDRFIPVTWPTNWDWYDLAGTQINERKTYKYTRNIGEWTSTDWQTEVLDGIVWVEWTYTHQWATSTYEERIAHYQWDTYIDFWWTQANLDDEISNWGIAIWDYIVAHDIDWGDAPTLTEPNGYWVITQINVVTWFQDGKIRVANPRTGFFVGNNGLQSIYQTKGTNIKFRRYKDWWETFAVVWCDGIYHFDGNSTNYESLLKVVKNGSNECWEQVNVNNGVISFITKNWFINYWGVGTQQYYFSSLNTRNIGKLTALATFNNYTVWFTRNSLSVVAYWIDQITWVNWQVFDTDSTRGIWSRDAYSTSIEWLKMIDSDRNFVYITLEPTNYWTFKVKLEDRSDGIKQHLRKIRKWDNVSITEDGNEINIIIQGRYWDWNRQTKTKMLIFDKFQKVWHIHTTWLVIKRKVYDEFLGERVYSNKYPWRPYNVWDWYVTDRIPYVQKLEAMLYSDKQKTIFNQVFLKDLIFSIGNRTRTNVWSTKFTMSANNWHWKPIYELDDITQVKYIENLNNVLFNKLVKPTEDANRLLTNCGSYINPCEWSLDIKHDDLYDDVEDTVCFTQEEKVFEDYWVCVDDKKHYLSEMALIDTQVPHTKTLFHWYHISITADKNDSFHTGWFMWIYSMSAIWDNNPLVKNDWDCVSCKKWEIGNCPECDTEVNHPDAECKVS